MCYHVSTAAKEKYNAYLQEYKADNPAFYYHTSGFDHQLLPITTNNDNRRIFNGVWGLVASDIETPAAAKAFADEALNARDDRLFFSKFSPYACNRCLIWVDGFYEWKHLEYKVPGKGTRLKTVKEKRPHYIYMPGHEPFSLGGIYNEWRSPATGHTLAFFAVLTTAATEFMAEIHNSKKRMPVIIDHHDRDRWLSDINKDEMKQLMQPYTARPLVAHTISQTFNTAGGHRNTPEIQQPFDYPEIVQL